MKSRILEYQDSIPIIPDIPIFRYSALFSLRLPLSSIYSFSLYAPFLPSHWRTSHPSLHVPLEFFPDRHDFFIPGFTDVLRCRNGDTSFRSLLRNTPHDETKMASAPSCCGLGRYSAHFTLHRYFLHPGILRADIDHRWQCFDHECDGDILHILHHGNSPAARTIGISAGAWR